MVARCAQEGLDVCRSALVISRLSRAAYECAPAASDRSPGSRACRHHQAGRRSYAAALLRHPSPGAEDRYSDIQVLLGHKKLDTTALYTRVAISTIGQVTSPLDFLRKMPGCRAAVVTAGGRGGGHLPPSRAGLACVPCRPCEPRSTQGHVGARALPNGGVGRPCRTLRGLCSPAHLLQLLPRSALSEVPGRRRQGMAG